jgi:hypothetical protein
MRRRANILILNSGAAPVAPPAQPTGLTATPITTARIDLAWTDAATNETAYKVYRSTDGVSYAQVGTDQAAGTQAYSDTTITAGVTYYYKVAAVNAGGETLSAADTANTLTLGLVAYWSMNEASAGSSAVTRNDSVGTNHLTDMTNFSAGAAGLINNAATFDGVSYFTIADPSSMEFGDADFSFSFWLYVPAASVGFPDVFGKDGATTNRNYGSYIDMSQNKIYFQVFQAGPTLKVANTAITRDAWQKVLCYHDAANNVVGISVNAAARVTTATTAALQADGTANFSVGWANTGDKLKANCRIDEFAVYNRVITTVEDTALTNGGSGIAYPFGVS